MSDAVLGFLVDNLTQLLRDEVELLSGVKDELESLMVQLKLMRDFLASCEGVRQDYPIVDTVVNQIRDLACDAEDVIDDYVFYAMEDRKKNRFTQFFSITKLTHKHSIGKRVKEIKKTMEEIYANKETYGIDVKKVSKEESVEGSFARRRQIRRPHIMEDDDVVGFVNDAKALVDRLIGGESRRTVIPIVGMGGLGKTTIAKKIFNDALVKNCFSSCRAWVYVSQQYTCQQLMLGILRSLKIRLPEEMNDFTEEELGTELRKQLEGRKYLIVLDDVWESQVWEDLNQYFPDEKNGSRILLTTRETGVASAAISPAPNKCIHHLRYLDKEESWELFRKKAFRGENCSHQWEKVGRQIAQECGGLPLAIVVLGSLLAEKSRQTFHEWTKVATRVSSYLSERASSCSNILALSYDALPTYLKPCFLYFAVFPEDHEIPAKQVIHLWVAEGLIEPKNGETLEETGERYLETLIDRSLVQVLMRRSDRGVKTCSIHDLLRDLCISESQSTKFLHFHGFVNSPFPTNPRRLVGTSKTIQYMCNCNRSSVARIRSLLCFVPASDTSWNSVIFPKFRLIRVFRVGDVGIFPEDVQNLMYLRYLALVSKTFINNPSTICMPRLQFLDANLKQHQKLPVEFWDMKKLRHIHLQSRTRLSEPRASASEDAALPNLQTLSTICPSSCTRPIFENLPNLLKLGVKGDLGKHHENLSQNLVILDNLHSLKLVGMTEFPPLVSLPDILPANIFKLTLCDTRLEEDPLRLLGNLQNLQILKFLGNAYTGEKMVFSADAFPCLQLLKLVGSVLTELMVETGALPNLEDLVIHDCFKLRSLTEISSLISLKLLDVRNPTVVLRFRMAWETTPSQIHIYPPSQKRQKVFFDINIKERKAGLIIMQLFNETTPRNAEYFRRLCTGEEDIDKPDQKPLHFKHSFLDGNISPHGCFGGEIITIPDASRMRDGFHGCFGNENIVSHSCSGLLSMHITNGYPDTGFLICTKEEPSLNRKNVVFGYVVDGYSIVQDIMEESRKDPSAKPFALIEDCGEIKEV